MTARTTEVDDVLRRGVRHAVEEWICDFEQLAEDLDCFELTRKRAGVEAQSAVALELHEEWTRLKQTLRKIAELLGEEVNRDATGD
jgi:hypothetical protein